MSVLADKLFCNKPISNFRFFNCEFSVLRIGIRLEKNLPAIRVPQ
jgi:hypothetical protein